MREKSSIAAIAACKCPRCRQGDMFEAKAARFWSNRRMHKSCPVCKLHFEPEPGFYYGGMYISYAVSVAVSVVVGIVLYNFFDDPPIWVYALSVTLLMILALPYSYRYSRVLMLHGFGGFKFDPKYQKWR